MRNPVSFSFVTFPISRHSLRHQRTTRVRPAEGMGKDTIEICYKIHQLITQIFHRGERARRTAFLMITPKTPSIWFSHELCFGV